MNNISLSSVSRREFLGAVGVAGAALGLGLPQFGHAVQTGKIPLGLELYSLREQCKTDLPGMLAAVSKIGYKGRLVGHGTRHTASTLLREHGWTKDYVEAQLSHVEEGVAGDYNQALYLPIVLP